MRQIKDIDIYHVSQQICAMKRSDNILYQLSVLIMIPCNGADHGVLRILNDVHAIQKVLMPDTTVNDTQYLRAGQIRGKMMSLTSPRKRADNNSITVCAIQRAPATE